MYITQHCSLKLLSVTSPENCSTNVRSQTLSVLMHQNNKEREESLKVLAAQPLYLLLGHWPHWHPAQHEPRHCKHWLATGLILAIINLLQARETSSVLFIIPFHCGDSEGGLKPNGKWDHLACPHGAAELGGHFYQGTAGLRNLSGHLRQGLEWEEGLPQRNGSLGQDSICPMHPDLFSFPRLLRAGAALVLVSSAEQCGWSRQQGTNGSFGQR